MAYFLPASDFSTYVVVFSGKASMVKMSIGGAFVQYVEMVDDVEVEFNSKAMYIDSSDTNLYLAYTLPGDTPTGVFSKFTYSGLSIQNSF